MPKQKIHKGLSKRMKITASGKVRYRRSGGSHLMSDKSAKRRRRIGRSAIMSSSKTEAIKMRLGK